VCVLAKVVDVGGCPGERVQHNKGRKGRITFVKSGYQSLHADFRKKLLDLLKSKHIEVIIGLSDPTRLARCGIVAAAALALVDRAGARVFTSSCNKDNTVQQDHTTIRVSISKVLIKLRRGQEARQSTKTSTDVITPGDVKEFDVMPGHMATSSRLGDVLYRSEVKSRKRRYAEAPKQSKERSAMITEIMNVIKSKGGRFLDYEREKVGETRYIEMEDKVARMKIQSLIR